jgi:hypothetical protein
MNMQRHLLSGTGVLLLALVTACKEPADSPAATAAAEEPSKPSAAQAEPSASPGKPTAPVAIDYDVIGVPLVGHPVNVDIAVSSTQGEAPVKLRWQVLDTGSLSFPESQAREVSLRVDQRQAQTRQVTIVPQREGRLYLNVTAEVETPDGAMLKTIAIPIQVGTAPGEPEAAGEVQQDADGEAVMSLPADEG